VTALEALSQSWAIVVALAGSAAVLGAALGRLTAPWSDLRRRVEAHHRLLVEPDSTEIHPLPRQVAQLAARLEAHEAGHAERAADLSATLARIEAALDARGDGTP